MMPVFARDILRVGETGLALLQGMAGAGALFGAIFLAYLGDFKRKGWFILLGDLAFAICLVGFSLSTNVRLSLFFLFALGFGIVYSVAVTNTLLQKLVTDEMRGRVMSMFMLVYRGDAHRKFDCRRSVSSLWRATRCRRRISCFL
jgi:predicted MFS family arabinose efflux permease